LDCKHPGGNSFWSGPSAVSISRDAHYALVVAAALLLNGIAGVDFGYLYWKRGLESAMIAHFCGDFVIYVLGVALLRFLPLH